MFSELQHVPAIYTLEATFSGTPNGLFYTPGILRSIGRDLCRTLIPYCGLSVSFVLPQSVPSVTPSEWRDRLLAELKANKELLATGDEDSDDSSASDDAPSDDNLPEAVIGKLLWERRATKRFAYVSKSGTDASHSPKRKVSPVRLDNRRPTQQLVSKACSSSCSPSRASNKHNLLPKLTPAKKRSEEEAKDPPAAMVDASTQTERIDFQRARYRLRHLISAHRRAKYATVTRERALSNKQMLAPFQPGDSPNPRLWHPVESPANKSMLAGTSVPGPIDSPTAGEFSTFASACSKLDSPLRQASVIKPTRTMEEIPFRTSLPSGCATVAPESDHQKGKGELPYIGGAGPKNRLNISLTGNAARRHGKYPFGTTTKMRGTYGGEDSSSPPARNEGILGLINELEKARSASAKKVQREVSPHKTAGNSKFSPNRASCLH